MKLKMSMVLAFAALSVLFSLPASAGSGEIAPGVVAFQGNDLSQPYDDLEPVRRIVGSAKFVGLGEPFHTSGGIYQMKHRLFRFLVEEMHFRAFGMETPWLNAEPVAGYVETCQGAPEDVIGGLFSIWRSTEAADLLRFMCEWNQEHPHDRVHFYGFDIQRQGKPSGDTLLAFLARLGFGDDHPWLQGIRACDGVVETYFPARPYPQPLYDQCQAALADVAAHFDDHENEIRIQTSREDLGWARIHLVTQQTWQARLFLPFQEAYGARERGMAYVAQAIPALRFPNEKVVLWAHNGHVARNTLPAFGLDSMGTHLAGTLGREYAGLGLGARQVFVNWPAVGYCGLVDFGADPSVESLLAELGAPNAIVDLAPRGNRPSFLVPGEQYYLGDLPFTLEFQAYDGLVVIDTSLPMHSLVWPQC